MARAAVADALAGRGALVLLAGEAGIGKTRLAEEGRGARSAAALRGAASPARTALRPGRRRAARYLRAAPDALDGCGPLRGAPGAAAARARRRRPPTSDRATLFEAIRCALADGRRRGPALVLLDDLQWSDDATLELLGALAATLPSRRCSWSAPTAPTSSRAGIRCGACATNCAAPGSCVELALEPLDAAAPPSWPPTCSASRRRRRWRARATTAPRACRSSSRSWPARWSRRAAARRRRRASSSRGDGDVPVPETIRDAVLLRAAELSDAARAAAEAAAVAGPRFELELVAALGRRGRARRAARPADSSAMRPGRARLPPRAGPRRALRGRPVAAAPRAAPGARRGARGARRSERRGRRALARRARRAAGARRAAARGARARGACTPTATPPAPRGRRSISGPTARARTTASRVLDRYARCAELAGELSEAARALREAAAARRAEGLGAALAAAERRLAALYELQGDRERALAAPARGRRRLRRRRPARRCRRRAAGRRRLPPERRQPRRGGRAGGAARATRRAAPSAPTCARGRWPGGRRARQARRVRRRPRDRPAGLSLALEHELTREAAELYQRLGTALEIAARLRRRARRARHRRRPLRARRVDAPGARLPELHGLRAARARRLGRGRRAVPRAIAAARRPDDSLVADGVLGAIHAFRGDAARGPAAARRAA